MKRIYFFSRLTRLSALLSLGMLLGLFVFALFVEADGIVWTLPGILFLSAVLFYTARRMYTYRILIDHESDRIHFILGIDKRYRYERQFSRIESIETQKEKGGFYFLVTHMSGLQEKLTYSCVRGGMIEKMQYRRLDRSIKRLMEEKTSADRADRKRQN